MFNTQVLLCDIQDLKDDNNIIVGYDPEKNEIYPTRLDDIVSDFTKDVKDSGGEIIQVIPIITTNTIGFIFIYTETSKKIDTLPTGLQVPK